MIAPYYNSDDRGIGISILDIASSDGLSQKPEDKSSSQAVNFLRRFWEGIPDFIKKALPYVTKFGANLGAEEFSGSK